MREIRFAILTTSDFPYNGAPENFVRLMSLGIYKHGVKLEVIRFWGQRYPNYNDTQIKCSNFLFKRPYENFILKLIESILQILFIPFFVFKRKFITNDSAIILYGLDRSYFVFPLTIWCKLFNIKCFRIITEVYPKSSEGLFNWRKLLYFIEYYQLKYFDKYFDGIIVLSHYIKNLCIKNSVSQNKILIIPHFIKINKKFNTTEKSKSFVIGYCGTITIENGIIDLLKAFKKIPTEISDIELIIIGELSDKVNREIIIQHLNSPRIRFTGKLSTDQVEFTIRQCSVLVNPRKSSVLAESGFPTKLGEYFSTGIPVITTKVGDLPYYFKDKAEVVFATPDCPDSILDAILFVYNHKSDAEKIGLNGFNWASEQLDHIKNSEKLINFIAPNSLDIEK